MQRTIETTAGADGDHDATITYAVPGDPATRYAVGVSRLFENRAELRGVYSFADLVEEAARWSA